MSADATIDPIVGSTVRGDPGRGTARDERSGEHRPAGLPARPFDAGLAWVHFPDGLGGLGLPRHRQPFVEINEYQRSA
ncbi:hypothetical protein [Micromonospora sp. NPDC005206]|uniref:hypothetical protein n=1 Tax=Micromonospora sp. NPDC005206 TaxID=3157022 RepID=UPI0033AF96A3